LYISYNLRVVSVTVKQILEVPGLALKLHAGKQGLERPIRWVHTSEHEDPTPWLRGGELLLATGMNVGNTPARQRAYVRRLADAGLAGLGFGTGFTHKRVPKPMVDIAEKLGFPLFEVPYPVPFIAISEWASTRLLAEQYETLQRATEAQQAMTRAVMEERGVEGVASSLAELIGGWALVLDLHGIPLAVTSKAARARASRIWDELRESRPDGTGFSLTLVDEGHHVWIQPVGARGRVEAFLAVGKPENLSAFDRVVAGHALSLLAIELSKGRAVAEAERRLQGDFFEALAKGSLGQNEASKGISRFGISPKEPVTVLTLEGGSPDDLAWAARDVFSRTTSGFIISPHEGGVHVLVSDNGGWDAEKLRDEIGSRAGSEVTAGMSSPVQITEVGRGLREARYALQVCHLERWGAAGFTDLGTYRLLLSMADPDALRAFADSLLGPLDEYDHEHGGELTTSLRAFLEHNARWETAAAELYVHRHTLRYRMRKVEELTGRSLSSSFDRMEFWLALRARELQSVQVDI
jgi:purine catabolism regulator